RGATPPCCASSTPPGPPCANCWDCSPPAAATRPSSARRSPWPTRSSAGSTRARPTASTSCRPPSPAGSRISSTKSSPCCSDGAGSAASTKGPRCASTWGCPRSGQRLLFGEVDGRGGPLAVVQHRDDRVGVRPVREHEIDAGRGPVLVGRLEQALGPHLAAPGEFVDHHRQELTMQRCDRSEGRSCGAPWSPLRKLR